jgi:protein arginine kinase activator
VHEGASFSVSDILLGQGPATPFAGSRGSSSCPECGLTLARLKKVGRLGCPACYEAFAKELKVILNSMHHAVEHKGRRPAHRDRNLSKREQEESLELALADAVAAEDYEKAAQLRDQLKSVASKEHSS